MTEEGSGRRSFIQKMGVGFLAAWAASVGGISRVFAQRAGEKPTLKPLTLNGWVKLPAVKPDVDCVAGDMCVEGTDVTVKCTVGCDGCDKCNNECNTCNACNMCDHGCDVGCNNCNKCNGCDGCDLCNATCNTCNQCDHGMDRCVVSCDGNCDGCNQGNQCNIDVNSNGIEDKREIEMLERNIAALEDTLARRKKALEKLRQR